MVLYGYAGKWLEVNLTDKSVKTFPTDPDLAKKYMGGAGYSAYLLWQKTPQGFEPTSPDNALIVSVGPLTPLGGDRTHYVFKSELSGLIGGCQHGGFLGSAIKSAGYDGIVILGKAATPSYLYIKDDTVEIRDATKYWGKGTAETDYRLREDLGDHQCQISCIGPAGENKVAFANIITLSYRSASQSGAGCIMGSKNLKAIVARGTKGLPPYAKWDEVWKYKNLLYERDTAERFGYKYGLTTMAHWRWAQAYFFHAWSADMGRGGFKNFSEGDHLDAHKVGGMVAERRGRIRNDTCTYCERGCEVTFLIRSGPLSHALASPNWDSTSNLGQGCLVLNDDELLYLNSLVDDLGLNQNDAAGVVEWAMECYEKGVLTKADLDGLDLTWGNAKAAAKLLEKIAKRDGVGNMFADGARKFLPKVGKGSFDWWMGCHGGHLGGQPPWTTGGAGLAAPVPFAACFGALSSIWNDSAGNCSFVHYTVAENVAQLNAVTGFDLKYPDDWTTITKRILSLSRAYSIREGYGGVMPPVKNDVVGEKWFRELTYGNSKGKVLTKDRALAERDKFYADQGWDANGVPTKDTLTKLGLEWTIPALEKVKAWG